MKIGALHRAGELLGKPQCLHVLLLLFIFRFCAFAGDAAVDLSEDLLFSCCVATLSAPKEWCTRKRTKRTVQLKDPTLSATVATQKRSATVTTGDYYLVAKGSITGSECRLSLFFSERQLDISPCPLSHPVFGRC